MTRIRDTTAENNTVPVNGTANVGERGEVPYVSNLNPLFGREAHEMQIDNWVYGAARDIDQIFVPCSVRRIILNELTGRIFPEDWARFVPCANRVMAEGGTIRMNQYHQSFYEELRIKECTYTARIP